MFDKDSYKLQIPEKACQTCVYYHQNNNKNVCCSDDEIEVNNMHPVDQCGICDNYKSKKQKAKKVIENEL